MEVSFTPDVQAKLDKLAIDTGRAPGELVEDVIAGRGDRRLLLTRAEARVRGTAYKHQGKCGFSHLASAGFESCRT